MLKGSSASKELAARMARPQRHRLLHGYPMLPLMPNVGDDDAERVAVKVDASRPLLVGVQHPFCNPKIRGCGFCTFAHEPYRRSAAAATTKAVTTEVLRQLAEVPELADKPVAGLYFGGGTANLTPPAEFRELCQALRRFELSEAEVTLEGAPRYFLAHDGALIAAIRELDARHCRLSLGVQSFDAGQLERMGRRAFGGVGEIAEVIERAHRLEMTISADLLINLPSQSVDGVLADLQQAVTLGFDQVCIYQLVLYHGLGTQWSTDEELLSALPTGATAFGAWQAARQYLLQQGYVQTTLTNFERADVARSSRRFVYERDSFHPDVFDAVGFGPGAISTLLSAGMRAGQKLVNCSGSETYRRRIEAGKPTVARSFDYGPDDMRLLFITRSLPLLELCRPTYRHLFGGDLLEHYPDVINALNRRRLVEISNGALRLSERGMFYADAVAGLFAWRRATFLRRRLTLPRGDAAAVHMG